jgi:hypothetical protein
MRIGDAVVGASPFDPPARTVASLATHGRIATSVSRGVPQRVVCQCAGRPARSRGCESPTMKE